MRSLSLFFFFLRNKAEIIKGRGQRSDSICYTLPRESEQNRKVRMLLKGKKNKGKYLEDDSIAIASLASNFESTNGVSEV